MPDAVGCAVGGSVGCEGTVGAGVTIAGVTVAPAVAVGATVVSGGGTTPVCVAAGPLGAALAIAVASVGSATDGAEVA